MTQLDPATIQNITFENNLIGFAEYYMKEYLTCRIPAFHKEIYTLLQDNTLRLALASPRSFAKSTICSVIFPLWLACYGKRKDIVIISNSEALAVEWLRKIKQEMEQNRRINTDFGDLKGLKWGESHLILKNGVNLRAKGAGGQIRGFRPDCLILDDIESDESVLSEEQRRKLKDWLNKACINTLEPTGQLIIIGTILHPLSLLNEILASEMGWTTKLWKAYKEGIEQCGYELWEEKWPHEALQRRKKEIGSFAFASEYMNNPISDETLPIKSNQIRYWDDLPMQYSCVMTVDPAYSEDAKADWKVASVVGIDHNMNRYLIAYVRTHAPTGEFINSALNLYLQHKSYLTAVGVPSGSEKEFYRSFLNAAASRNLAPPVVELKHTYQRGATQVSVRNKKKRIIAALQPLFEAGKYFIHRNHSEALDEILAIGFSRWDDIIDTLAYAEQIIEPGYLDIQEETVDRYGTPIQSPTINNYGME